MRSRNVRACFALLATFALSGLAADRDRLSIEQLLDWEYVAFPQVSPDGSQIVNTRRWTDKINNRFESAVWIMNSDGGDMTKTDEIHVKRTERDIAAAVLDSPLWNEAEGVLIDTYWSGEKAPATRQAKAQLLWSDKALYVKFVCEQHEPIVASAHPRTDAKTLGLWDRDVAEIFVGPDVNEPEKYFEFEAGPNGEWVDLGIRQLPDKRETDWEFHSGVTTAARIEKDKVTMTMRIPWKSFGFVPQRGQRLRTNLFRCVGTGKDRGYLAWRPTRTTEPSFHVPQAFGWLVFG